MLFYSGTGNADGVDGDQILIGPPFVVTDDELETLVAVLDEALDAAVASVRTTTAVP